MKKSAALLTTGISILALAAFSINFTLAYFTDMDTAFGTDTSAGFLEVSVDLDLANYGVPGDTMLTSYDSKATPAKSTVTVINKGSIDMDYTLSLTVDKETSDLLDADGFELRDSSGEILQFISDPTSDIAGNTTYVYESTDALKNDESHVFDLSLKFKGSTLLDGNDFQNKPISVTPTVIAIQTGGAKS